ncbi:hypothetical protein FALCPG4_015962 [Fusarium falciforme]
MAPQPPRLLGRITKKSPTELSRYKLVSKPPRKLATEKCDNCRKGKLKCVPQGLGCQRCSQKRLPCPGLTKVKRNKPQSPVSLEPSPSSTATTPSAAGMSSEALDFVLIKPLIPESTFDAQLDQLGRPIEDAEPSNIWGATPELTESVLSDSDISPCVPDLPELVKETSPLLPPVQEPRDEESDALEELQGLEIGLDLLDELEDEDEETMGDDAESIGPGQEVSAPAAVTTVWDDLRADYVRIYGKAPCEPPDFIMFLKRLRPTKTGSVECPSCRWSCDGEFDLSYIKDHFRFRHVGNICYADKKPVKPRVWIALSKLMAETEAQKIIGTLKTRCSDIEASREQLRIAARKPELPSAIVFLIQLRPFCNGQLTCAGPKCKGTHFFDATWDDLKSHYEKYHADYLLRNDNIQGQLDVESHLACQERGFERLFTKARALHEEWASMDGDAREVEEIHCKWSLEYECSALRRLPRMPQLLVLKDLNRVFRSRHRRFHRLAAESLSMNLRSFADGLRAKCPKPKDLRRLGTRIFRQVVQGISPTTLLEIFAFISLSQTMGTVMRRWGIKVDLDPRTGDYFAWRTCIEDEADRSLYDEILLAWFHPKWKQELTVDGTNQTPLSAQEAMKQLVLQLMKAKQTSGAFKFSAFMELDPLRKKRVNRGSTYRWRGGKREFAGSPVDAYPSEMEEDDPGDDGTERLEDTAIFIGVCLFMIFIAALGVTLLYLSNPQHRCHVRSAAGEDHMASICDVVLAAEKLKDRILDRLRRDPSISVLDDIVTTAEEALSSGYVWSVSDFHLHLEQAVQNHIEEPGLRSQLYAQIRHWCKEALDSIETICENHRGGCMRVPVRL